MELDLSGLERLARKENHNAVLPDCITLPHGQMQLKHGSVRLVRMEYGQCAIQSEQLRSEILKGVRLGESPHLLFLKAAKTISIMTANPAYYAQIERDMKSIYGAGRLETKPLEIELKEVKERLNQLQSALKGKQPPDTLRRIQAAVKAHKERKIQLEQALQKKEKGAKQE